MTERRFALIIANGEYDDPLIPNLDTPKHDAEGLSRVLSNPAIGGFLVQTLIDGTAMEVRKTISRFFRDKQSDDLLLLFFSGHGFRSDSSARLYLAVRDTEQEDPSVGAIEATFINQRMDEYAYKRVILILNCCYSGAAHSAFMSANQADLPDDSSAFSSGFGRVVITASRAGERAQASITPLGASQPSPYSLFAHYLIEGLETGAGATGELITVETLFEYVSEKIKADSSRPLQTPRMKMDGLEGKALQIARNHRYERPVTVGPILGHHFLCYSPVDGRESANALYERLCEAGLPVWLDRKDARQDLDFNAQVEEALRGCASLVFVLTPDSVHSADAEREWRRALQYKKPVVLARFAPSIEPPLLLNNRQVIDLSENFLSSVEMLYKHLQWRSTPEGLLTTYKERMSDAHRDLRMAQPQESSRIQSEIKLLNMQITEQEQMVFDPQEAAKRTQNNINSGLERERQLENLVVGKARTRFINPPPGIAPEYFQDRYVETQLIGGFLKDPALRVMTVIGRAGIGKTALVCRLLKTLENGQLPNEEETFSVGGIIYLSAVGTHQIKMANLFDGLCHLLAEAERQELKSLYQDVKISPTAKIQALLSYFPPLMNEEGTKPVVVLLDNFEDLVDPESQRLKDAEMEEALQALLESTPHRVKVLITTRLACRKLLLCQPGRQRTLTLDSGLESPYAENILREMDADGKVGLRTAPDSLLGQARERTRGYPRALEALYGILSADRYTSLEEVLMGAEQLLPENVVEALIGQAYNRLDSTAQQVLQSLAIYGRPVSSAAIDYLLQPYLPGLDSASVLNRLVNMHFTRHEGGKYYLHPVDLAYAFGRIPLKSEDDEFTQTALLHRAADYFAKARLPRSEWKTLNDLSAQLAEIDLRFAAGEGETAAEILTQIDELLMYWGHSHLQISLFERALPNIKQPHLLISCLNNLGIAYMNLGNLARASDCYEKAIKIDYEIGNRYAESVHLSNLGICYAWMGQVYRSIECNEQALKISRELGDKRDEAYFLSCLGNRYSELGQPSQAISLFEQALAITPNVGDLREVALILDDTGDAFLDLGEFEKALESYQQAQVIGDNIASVQLQSWTRWGKSRAYLFLGNLAEARISAEEASKFNYPPNNHNVSAILGLVTLLQNDPYAAKQAFSQAITNADALLANTPYLYEALDAKGLTLCGLALAGEPSQSSLIEQAMTAYQEARKIINAEGVVGRALRLFDALAQMDREGLLDPVRLAASGKDISNIAF